MTSSSFSRDAPLSAFRFVPAFGKEEAEAFAGDFEGVLDVLGVDFVGVLGVDFVFEEEDDEEDDLVFTFFALSPFPLSSLDVFAFLSFSLFFCVSYV